MANMLIDATNQCTLFTLDSIPFYDENKSELSELSELWRLQLKRIKLHFGAYTRSHWLSAVSALIRCNEKNKKLKRHRLSSAISATEFFFCFNKKMSAISARN